MSENVFEVSPELLKKCEELGEYFTIEINRDLEAGRVEVRYVPVKPCPYIDTATLTEKFSNQVAWGHATAFGMKGQIADVGSTLHSTR
jgi:hypothetical protein